MEHEIKLKKFHWICRNKRCKEDEREVLSEPGGEGELACDCCGYLMERVPQGKACTVKPGSSRHDTYCPVHGITPVKK